MPQPAGRVRSLDVFRGATVAAMLLVNNPGSFEHTFPPLAHADWNGWTLADLVFPFFLFIMGAAIAFSRRLAGAGRSAATRVVLQRAAIIIALGLFISAFPRFELSSLRYLGVLQRIGICYAAVALGALWLSPGVQLGLAFALLVAYQAVLLLVSPPGSVAPDLSVAGNLVGSVDRIVLGQAHMLGQQPFDPEGLLSTIPAIATTCLGLVAGLALRASVSPGIAPRVRRTLGRRVLASGMMLALAGLGLGRFGGIPINKQLWTPAYVLFTGGLAAVVLVACSALLDRAPDREPPQQGSDQPSAPRTGAFTILGRNAILIYVGSLLLAKVLTKLPVTFRGEKTTPQQVLYEHLLLPRMPSSLTIGPEIASLLYAAVVTAAWFAVAWLLHRRRIYLRV
ncbi:MAG: DUF5009 domain-containing protein [Phycisphaeraceae bacterium]|nr:DUF5009 domain-containing protein [Phycisphaeraceae bacterium]